MEQIYNSSTAGAVNIPFIVMAIIHMLFVIPQICLHRQGSIIAYILETALMASVAAHFGLQLARDLDDKGKNQMKFNYAVGAVDLVIWVSTYVLFFYPWPQPKSS